MNAQADEFLIIDTPENVVFGYEVAGIGSRFLAAFVDSLLIGGLVLLVFLTAGMVLSVLDIFAGLAETSERAAGFILALSALLTFAFVWGYYVFFELLWNGQSPGKRWVGLRVLGTQGQPVGVSEAVIRNLIRLIDLLPGTYAVGIITMFVNDQSRRLGDFAAGTLVVYDRGMVSLEMLGRSNQKRPLLRPNDQILETMADLPVEQLDEEDIILVESFLDRHHDLPNRSVLADQLIAYLFRSMSVPPRPVASSEAISFLQGIEYWRRTSAMKLAAEKDIQRAGLETNSGGTPLEMVAGGEQSSEDWTRKGIWE
jgi:uncharacterized RDD family membrane protein YckC